MKIERLLAVGCLLVLTWTGLACTKPHSVSPLEHQKMLEVTADNLVALGKNPNWKGLTNNATEALQMTRDDLIAEDPYLVAVCLVRQARKLPDKCWAGMVWLKREDDVERSTVSLMCFEGTVAGKAVILKATLKDRGYYQPRGYYWVRDVDVDVVEGTQLRFQSRAKGRPLITMGEQVMKQGVWVWIEDEKGRASNKMRLPEVMAAGK